MLCYVCHKGLIRAGSDSTAGLGYIQADLALLVESMLRMSLDLSGNVEAGHIDILQSVGEATDLLITSFHARQMLAITLILIEVPLCVE